MGIFDKLLKGASIPEQPKRESLTTGMVREMGLTIRALAPDEPLKIDAGITYRGSPVGWSHDLQRIVELPRRTLAKCVECAPIREATRQRERETGQVNEPIKCKACDNSGLDPAAAQAWTKHLRRERSKEEGACDCKERFGFCLTSFKPIQGWALEEASDVGGLLGFIGAGHGKTGIVNFLPMAIPEVKRAVAMVQSNLKPQFLRDFAQWSAHFKTPNLAGGSSFVTGRPVLHVVTYHELSSKRSTDLFSRINPDLVICDEAHNISNLESSRGMRFERLFERRADRLRPRYVALSGTLLKKALQEIAPHAEYSLDQGSPVPLHQPTVEEWGTVLNPGKFDDTGNEKHAPAGQLRHLCQPGETAREGFRRRLIDTSGVIATEEAAVGTTLVIGERKIESVPAALRSMIKDVNDLWQRPDGEELVEAIEKYNVTRQLAAGFYYRWIWPRGEPVEVILAWLEARKNWNKEVRSKLKDAIEHMDSPLLLTNAAIRWHDGYVYINPETKERREIPPHTRNGPYPVWASEFFPRWRDIRDTAHPETEAVWVSDFLVEDAIEWAKSRIGIVWYSHASFGQRIAELGNLTFYGPGAQASAKIIRETGKRSIVASIDAHGTGKNLQYAFSRNLITNCIADGATVEQLIARTHRPGQPADQVDAEFHLHTDEVRADFRTAYSRARFIYETTGNPQKLLYANYLFDPKAL